jgi:phage gp29-like protein
MNLRQVKAIAKWRAQFNPLRGLTFQRAVSMLEDGERGSYADLTWTYRFIEKRDATLRGLKRLRLAALAKLDWNIKQFATGDDTAKAKQAEKQAQILRQAYDRIANLKQAIAFLALAEFRGFSHLEKVYEGDNPTRGVVALEPVPQWHWCRDTLYGPWQYDPSASSGRTTAEEIDLQHFIVREVEDPIDEIGLLFFLRKNLSQKDWDGFVETYGIPPLFAEMPPNVPAGKEAEYQAMAEAVVSDMRGTLPAGAKMHTVDAGARGMNPFRDHLTYGDEQLVLAGTSGKLTMLNGPTGLGSGQSDVHQDTFDELAQAEAAEISEIFQKQFDRAVLDAAGFEGQPVLAYFELAAQDKADVGALLDHAEKATRAGYQMDAEELSEKSGYKLTLRPASPGPGFGTAGVPPQHPKTNNRATPLTPTNEDLRTAVRDQVARALAAKLKPIRERLQAAMDADDDAQMAEALTEAKAAIEAHAKRLSLDPADPLVRAIEDGLATVLVEGAVNARQAHDAQTRNRGGLLAWLRNFFTR